MKKLFPWILPLSICLVSFLPQEQEKEHPIDVRCKKCIDDLEIFNTIEVMKCESTAAKEWDKELNKYFKLLMDTLPKSQGAKLRNAQRKWMEYRDLDAEFSSEMYLEIGGSMFRMVNSNRYTERIKTRTLELENYYQAYTFDPK